MKYSSVQIAYCYFFVYGIPLVIAGLCQIRIVCIHKINATELSPSLLLSVLSFFFCNFCFQTDKLKIRVTSATFKFERQTQRCLLMPFFVVIVTEERF